MMLHEIPVSSIPKGGREMADAISACVHCGFCLPACPTYMLTGQETESPRGRILLMKHALEGKTPVEEAAPHIDRCLGCLGCVPACPSGVPYGNLLDSYRAWSEPQRNRPATQRFFRRVMLKTLSHPKRALWSIRLGRAMRPLRWLLPGSAKTAIDLLPKSTGPRAELPTVTPAAGKRRAKVALLAGCVQQVLAQEINLATIKVLADNGIEVVVPTQSCCGALAGHAGELELGKQLARKNFELFPKDVDAFVTNAAGCGSAIQDYPNWFRDDDMVDEAKEFANKAVDVSVFLSNIGLARDYKWTAKESVAYQDACHLINGQSVSSQPRQLLRQIQGLELLELPGANHCCGSAGIYNLEQPAMANQLGEAKAQAIADCRADIVCTGNIGCMMQMKNHLNKLDRPVQVLHTMQILEMSSA